MGPPKKRPPKVPYSELKRRWDTFEYRWDGHTGSYYLYNPWTGETVFSTNLEFLDRSQSLWAPIEKYPSNVAETIQVLPNFYLSRRWGIRRFTGWKSKDEAAIHMTAVARGFLARLYFRRYYSSRYCKIVDENSGYYYYVDKVQYQVARVSGTSETRDTTFYKPRLAFPNDIKLYVKDDPDDYLRGTRYSRQDFKLGPILKVTGVNKSEAGRSDVSPFIIHNPVRWTALKKYEEIDLSNMQLGDVVDWREGEAIGILELTEYHLMRAAVVGSDWYRVLHYMRKYEDNLLIQIYGLQNFSKTEVPMDGTVVDYVVQDALDICLRVIRDPEGELSQLYKVYAMRALHNIMTARPARVEYLSQEKVTVQGEFREAAIEAFYKDRLGIFNQYLTTIPYEEINVYEKGQKEPHKVMKPLQRSVELVAATLRCLTLLAQEAESRESLCYIVAKPTLYAMDVCLEEAVVQIYGLQLLYNLCYRCESGQEAILHYCKPQELLDKLRLNHQADPDVSRQARRFELAIMKDGWRGNVEEIITKEMKSEDIEEYLKKSEYDTKTS